MTAIKAEMVAAKRTVTLGTVAAMQIAEAKVDGTTGEGETAARTRAVANGIGACAEIAAALRGAVVRGTPATGRAAGAFRIAGVIVTLGIATTGMTVVA